MPNLDLRDSSGALDPLAPFKLLAVMCHPDDEQARKRMMAHLHRGTGRGTSRRKPLEHAEFVRVVDRRARRGGLAGALVLTMLQLKLNGLPATLDAAMAIITARLAPWIQALGSDWHVDLDAHNTPRSRRKVLEAFHAYRPVGHFWAAYVHGREHERNDPADAEDTNRAARYSPEVLKIGTEERPEHAGDECDRCDIGGRKDEGRRD